ncbi:MAG: GtrA family protein [Solirubrobacterales bacterium]|nr:GtrA family protein [Solirubrobacterales bacterium]
MYDEATVVPLPLHHRVRAGIRHPGNWRQLGRYGVVGLLGYLVNNAVFALCVHVLSIDFRVAAVLAFLVSVTHNFIWSRHWTFDARDGHAGFQAARFFTVSVAAFGVTFGVLNLLVSAAHFPKVPANALAVIAGVPLSFLGQKLWSFKR